jgi:hypothetical protein
MLELLEALDVSARFIKHHIHRTKTSEAAVSIVVRSCNSRQLLNRD